VQHVLNRGNFRERIFHDDEDYEDFICLLGRAADHVAVPLLAFSLMPNHWHLVLWPSVARDLSAYMHWLTTSHVRRTHGRWETTGLGHIYQERYRTVAVKGDEHFLTLCRYVESNALTAGLVEKAEQWPYSSLSRQVSREGRGLLSPWPVARPDNWLAIVNGNCS
jgi:putative transposase